MKILVFLNFFTIYSTILGQEFSYNGLLGPAYWGNKYQTCVGKHQSPINIVEHYVEKVTLPPLWFSGFNIPRKAMLTNNGHTVLLKTIGTDVPLITGGPLRDDVYAFEQLHFHWGENDKEGSEDRINNRSFAMELHAVFYKLSYGSYKAATNFPDGLTVLAYFVTVDETFDPTYSPLVETLPLIEDIGSEAVLRDNLILESILKTNQPSMQNYFTYNGSLTTPPCSEVVTWIDFKKPHILSHEQIEAFRRIRSAEGERVTHNFRPVQPLADRIVFENIPETSHDYSHGIPNHRNHHHPQQFAGQLANRASLPIIVIISLATVLRR
ncbi:carbonic anhydrase 7 [Neodiprion fabricii]|uniref:carbonic anhydrase 7 n=1 Tax=Neodiprion fabricii TaxID=2872261 RepID=UPI001ED8DAB6|nr:carbonic anhydrase 7 [Neodiprion fabricii]